MVEQIFSHLSENSKHDTQLCKDKQDPSSLVLPDSLADFLTEHVAKYLSKSVIQRMTLTTTTNECEAINKSSCKLLPKDSNKQNTNTGETYACITMILANHGQIIHKHVLLALGVPENQIPNVLIQYWNKMSQKNKQDEIKVPILM